MADLAFSAPVFTILTALVEERVGMSYSLSEREIFESKVSARARDAGFESMLDYYYYLRYDDPDQREFSALVEALLVHETFLFREFEPLRVAIEQFIAPEVKAGRRPRIWCAACSTGEEPATLAMLLDQRDLLHKVDLVASDISSDALARARKGVFSARALRQPGNHSLATRYLTTKENLLVVGPELIAPIDYRQVNLIDGAAVAALGSFDLISCRNVLIYFREERMAAVVGHLTQSLRPEGALLVGVSESLMRFGSGLRCEEHAGVFVYRKRKDS
jgi:chemotaxis protein methyltransferase CheR